MRHPNSIGFSHVRYFYSKSFKTISFIYIRGTSVWMKTLKKRKMLFVKAFDNQRLLEYLGIRKYWKKYDGVGSYLHESVKMVVYNN